MPRDSFTASDESDKTVIGNQFDLGKNMSWVTSKAVKFAKM